MGTLYQVDGATGQARITIQNGTSNPVSGTLGELHYRSDQDQLQIYDGTTFKAVLGGSYRVYREKVNETPNGSITAFTVDNPYVNTTTEVYLNGVLQEITTDYTETNPATGTITFTVAPLTGAIITVSYSRLEGSSLPLFNKFSVTVGTPVDTYSGSTTVFDLPFAFTPGAGNLLIFSSGVLMLPGATEDYQETDLNTITFNTARTAGEIVQFIKVGAANDEGTSGWADSGTIVALKTTTDQVQVGDGTAGSPALSFISDNDTGFFKDAANRLQVALNGVEYWRWGTAQASSTVPIIMSTVNDAFMQSETTDNDKAGFYKFTNTVATHRIGIETANDAGGGAFIGGPSTLNLETNSAHAIVLSTNSIKGLELTSDQRTRFADGSAALPSLSFINDTDTGIFRPTTNTLAFAVGASEWLRLDSSGNLLHGTTSATGYFTSRLDQNARTRFAFTNDNGSSNASADIYLAVGSGGSQDPRITFAVGGPSREWVIGCDNSDSDIFVIQAGVSSVELSGGGAFAVTPNATPQQINPDGTASLPYYSFYNDQDTGIYRSGGNEFSVSTGGVQRLRFSASPRVLGGWEWTVNSYSASTTAAHESVILMNASGGARTVTLPPAAGIIGRTYMIKKTDSSLNTVTVDADGSETIDGSLTYVLTAQYESVTITTDGSNWFVI